MRKRTRLCVVLLTLSGISGCLGYLKTRPTAMERLAAEAAKWAVRVNPADRQRVERQMEEVTKARYRRGLPYLLAAGIGGIFGIAALSGRDD